MGQPWEIDSTAELEARVHYTTQGGSEVVVPCVTIIDRGPANLITSLRIHPDAAPLYAAPLYAAMAAEAAQPQGVAG